MTATFAPRAKREIKGILDHILTQSAQGANSVSMSISSTIKSCEQFPRTASKTNRKNIFRKPLAKFPYTIFYRYEPKSGDIEIVAVVHSARVKSLSRIPKEDD